jgi:hypothetical protein
MRTILTAAMMVVAMAAVPDVASAQDARHEAMPAFGSTLKAATTAPISAREFEQRFAPAKRSALTLSLYGTLAGLNVLDVVSTRQAVGRGAVELNPLMKDAIGDNAMSFGIKGATTLATILAIDRIAKRNRKAGIVAAVIANGVTAAIVANNLRQAR